MNDVGGVVTITAGIADADGDIFKNDGRVLMLERFTGNCSRSNDARAVFELISIHDYDSFVSYIAQQGDDESSIEKYLLVTCLTHFQDETADESRRKDNGRDEQPSPPGLQLSLSNRIGRRMHCGVRVRHLYA